VRIVLTREAGRDDAPATTYPDGAHVDHVPLTTTRYRAVDEVERELRSLAAYGAYRALVITSARSADYVAAARNALASDGQVFSVGPATTQMLMDRGVGSAVQASTRALDLADAIAGGPVLMVGAAAMRDELPAALGARGIDVARVGVYETLPLELVGESIEVLREGDVVVIGAPSAWSVAREHVADRAWVVVPGPTTAGTVRRDHERVVESHGQPLRQLLAALAL